MKRALCYTAIFFLLLTIGFWTAFQFDSVQTVAKDRLSKIVEEKTGYKVEIASFSGAMPFLLGIHDVKIQHPDIGEVYVQDIYAIPSWLEFLFGRFSLLYCTIDGLDLRALKISQDDQEFTPPKVYLAIHSLHVKDIRIPRVYYDPLITSYGEQAHVECLFSLSGGLSWHPRNERLSLSAYLLPYISDLSPASIDIELTLQKEQSTVEGRIDLLKMPDGGPFVSLFCDKITLDFALKADLFTEKGPFFTGSWNLSGLKRIKEGISLNPVVRFNATGSLHAPTDEEITFSATSMQAQKIEPLLSYAASKKTRLSQELLLADSEEPQDASTLSHITSLPVPKQLEASLKREDDRYIAHISSKEILVGNQTIPSCNLKYTFNNSFKGLVDLNATVVHENRELPISLTFANALEANTIHLKDIELALAGLLLKGDFDVDLDTLALQGSLKSDSTSVDSFLDQFSAKAHALSLSATSTKDESSLLITCERFVHPELSCGNLSCSLTKNSNGIQTASSVEKLVGTNVSLQSAKLDTSDGKYTLELSGKSKNGTFSASSTGSISPTQLTIDKAKSIILGHEINVDDPFTITYQKGLYRISPFAVTSKGKTILQGQLEMKKHMTSAQFTAADLPLECLDPFLGDATLFGNISGRLDLSGANNNPTLALTCASSSLQLWNPKLLDAPSLAASCEVTMKDDLVQAALEIEGLSQNVPTHLTFIKDKNKLVGTMQAEFDLATLLSSYLDEDELVEGIVSLDACISGTKEKPEWKGTLDLHQAKLFVPCLGTSFSDLEAHAKLKDNQLVIESLNAKDDGDGTFTANGHIKNLLSKKFQYKIDGKSNHFATIVLPEAEAKATGTLIVTGTLHEANFAADMDVEDAKFYLSPSSSKEVPKIAITYVGEDHAPIKMPFQIGLDLSLKMNEGYVVGMGLDSTWKGDAKVTGINKNIDVQGNILLAKGNLEFAGKHFTLTQGSLKFAGDLLKQSTLQVTASNDVAAISTQIALQGPLEHPRIVLQSNPAMSQKEILSWLLFNKSSSDITPMQGIQLGQHLLKLKSGNNSVDLIEELKQKLSIDRIDFGQASTTRPKLQESMPNEVSVQVGKYIYDGVIVTLSKDVTNEVNRVGVEANLTKHITAQANVGDDANAELSLEWKLRY